jgi:hypothetical protein
LSRSLGAQADLLDPRAGPVELGADEMRSVVAGLISDTIWFIERLQHEVESEFLARLGIEAQVRFIEPPHQRPG